MKFNKMILLGLLFLAIFTIGAVGACDNLDEIAVEDTGDADDNLTVENVDEKLTVGNQSDSSSSGSPEVSSSNVKSTPIKTKVKFSNDVGKYKKSKYFKIKITNKKTKKPIKNLKFKFKVKLSKGKYKTYTLKTNKKGIAKYNMKKLKQGVHLVYLLSSDKHIFSDGDDKTPDWSIGIWKTKKTVNLKMGQQKKVCGENMYASYETRKDGQNPQGTYVFGDIGNENPGFIILKAKFFFKNKKSGKIISKSANYPKNGVKLVKGYKPVEVKVWYGTLKGK